MGGSSSTPEKPSLPQDTNTIAASAKLDVNANAVPKECPMHKNNVSMFLT